jgi:hypothetical protein
MSPEFTTLAETDLFTSKSANPEGETTKDLEVVTPDLTSNPSFLRIYVVEAFNTTRCAMLTNQTTKKISAVHNHKDIARNCLETTPNTISNQKTTTATTMTPIVLPIKPGRIQGLPTQTTESEVTKGSLPMPKPKSTYTN